MAQQQAASLQYLLFLQAQPCVDANVGESVLAERLECGVSFIRYLHEVCGLVEVSKALREPGHGVEVSRVSHLMTCSLLAAFMGVRLVPSETNASTSLSYCHTLYAS